MVFNKDGGANIQLYEIVCESTAPFISVVQKEAFAKPVHNPSQYFDELHGYQDPTWVTAHRTLDCNLAEEDPLQHQKTECSLQKITSLCPLFSP